MTTSTSSRTTKAGAFSPNDTKVARVASNKWPVTHRNIYIYTCVCVYKSYTEEWEKLYGVLTAEYNEINTKLRSVYKRVARFIGKFTQDIFIN